MGARLRADLDAHPAISELRDDFDAIRSELQVREAFPEDALEEAAEAARRTPRDGRVDMRDVPFATVDPPGSRDLDQALCIEQSGAGYRVRYAIADVAFFVARGGAVEREAWLRGVTAYAPDRRAPLYPPALGEGAASLLPDAERPAIVFDAQLGPDGAITAFALARAVVRSRRQLTYAEVGAEGIPFLREVGELRERQEEARGGVRLDLPAQEVVPSPANARGFALRFEQRVPSEDWNAQISLLTGLGAARTMLEARVGLLRVMDPPDPGRLAAARGTARQLGVDWRPSETVAELVRGLDGRIPNQEALLVTLRRAMGRARYAAFEGAPPALEHAALAAPYAHVTAPLRRLADRYVLDLLCTLATGARPSADEVATLRRLPQVMARAEARAGRLERAIVDDVEVRLLEHRVGERFAAVTLAADGRRPVQIQLADPPVIANLVDGDGGSPPEPGEPIEVVLRAVDVSARRLELARA